MDQNRPPILEGIEEMRRQLSDALSRVLPEDLTARAVPQIEAVISALMEKFQLVPREEFDQYLDLLKRLNQEVETLARRVTELEAPENERQKNA